jgi:competence protein ComGD
MDQVMLRSVLRNNGYTLIEALIVVLIFTTLLSWSFFSLSPLKDHIEKKAFIASIQSDLYYLQSYSSNYQATVKLTFYPNKNMYSARDMESGNIVTSRELPTYTSIVYNSSLKEVTFYPNGNTNKFGSLYLQVQDSFIKLTMQIGQGRFDVQEL